MRARVVAALVVWLSPAVAGGWFRHRHNANRSDHDRVGRADVSGAGDQLKDAAKVEITHQDTLTVIEKRPDGGWGVVSMMTIRCRRPSCAAC